MQCQPGKKLLLLKNIEGRDDDVKVSLLPSETSRRVQPTILKTKILTDVEVFSIDVRY